MAFIKKDKKHERLIITLSLEQKKRLKAICGELNITMNDLIRSILNRTLDKIEITGRFTFDEIN